MGREHILGRNFTWEKPVQKSNWNSIEIEQVHNQYSLFFLALFLEQMASCLTRNKLNSASNLYKETPDLPPFCFDAVNNKEFSFCKVFSDATRYAIMREYIRPWVNGSLSFFLCTYTRVPNSCPWTAINFKEKLFPKKCDYCDFIF